MELEVPYRKKLYDVFEDRLFKRKLILWHYYVKNLSQKDISEWTEIPKSTVNDVIKKWEENGVVEDLPRTGREKEITKEDRKLIIDLQKENRTKTATTIHTEVVNLGHDVSYQQTLRTINDTFFSLYAPYKIQLTMLTR